MTPMLNMAVRAARSAGNVIVRSLDRLDRVRVETKGRNDFVSDVDRAAEEEIVGTLRQAYPDHAFMGEEGGSQGDSDHVWIIDPLDGTTNFLYGLPHFAVSIALQVRGRIELGVVYDPVRQELFTAARGNGATVDDHRVRVRTRKDLDGQLLATGFPFRHPQHMDAYMGQFRAVIDRAGDLRRAGSAALDLAYVAAGRLDGYWELGLKPWDIAAGALLVREAGGVVCDFGGDEGYMRSGNVVAGNPKLVNDLLGTIRPHCTAAMLRGS